MSEYESKGLEKESVINMVEEEKEGESLTGTGK